MPQEFLNNDHVIVVILQQPDGAVAASTEVVSRAQAVQLFLSQKRGMFPQKVNVVFLRVGIADSVGRSAMFVFGTFLAISKCSDNLIYVKSP